MTVSPNSSPPHNDQDPAQRDAERVQRHYPISFTLKLLAFLLALFALLCVALYVAAGTERGTAYLIDKMNAESGLSLAYGEGNLRDGLLLKDVVLKASDDIEVHFINAYVKIGWRAIFVKEVHLRDADIERIEIINHKPPTGDPFDYKRLELPVNIRFDSTRIDSIEYDQAQTEPVIVTDVFATNLSWSGTQVDVGEGHFQYAELVKINGLTGFIQLEDNYPLTMDATVTVFSLQKQYVAPIEVQATGSLKRTYGLVRSHYNKEGNRSGLNNEEHDVSFDEVNEDYQSEVIGEFMVQGLDKNAPFDAKIMWDKITLPYLENEHVTLQNGLVIASGVLSDIDLRINSELSADHYIPDGHYQGRAKVVNSQLLIEALNLQSTEGDLLAQGVIDWQDGFTTKALVTSDNYQIPYVLPESFSAYAPERLKGQLAVVFNNKNADELMQINADLKQRDGEHINARVVQGVEPENPRFNAPWEVDARWQNVRREDLPNLGPFDSPSGKAEVTLRDNRLWATATAQVNELNAAPAGDYQVKLSKVNDSITLKDFKYSGIMGNLLGTGQITLANQQKPLTWQVDARTTELLPQAFNKDLPINRLVGTISASGRMRQIRQTLAGKTVAGQQHDFTVKQSDLTVTLDSEVRSNIDNSQIKNAQTKLPQNRRITIQGSGAGMVALRAGELQDFDAQFKGQVDSQELPKGQWVVNTSGTAENITIKQLQHTGVAGRLNASGAIDLTEGIGWDVKADANDFNLGLFVPQTDAVVTGKLNSSGKWRQKSKSQSSGLLQAFDLQFDGSVDTPQLPQGKLIINAEGDAKAITLRRFSHSGEAGSLSAKGTIHVRDGVAWDIQAAMDEFNAGYFINSVPSTITGKIATTGLWSNQAQRINVSQMSLAGSIKGKPLRASGQLQAVVHLPSNMAQYLDTLKVSDASGQFNQVNALVEKLDADNLSVQWADNQVVIDGNAKRLQARVNIRNLNQFSKDYSGTIVGGLIMTQSQHQALPTIYVDLTAEKVILPKVILNKGVVEGKIVNLGKRSSKLVLLADGLQVANNQFDDVKAVFEGTESAHSLSVQTEAINGARTARLKALIKGKLDLNKKQWQGTLGNGEIATEYVALSQSQPAQLVANFAASAPSLQMAAHCWEASDNTGKLCFQDNLRASSDRGQVNLTIQQLDTTLFNPFMPKDLSWQASINGKLALGWQKGQEPSINGTLYSDNGKIGMIQEGRSQPATMPYKRISLIVRSSAKGLKVRTDINSGRGARGYVDVVIDPFKESKPISGAVVLNEFNLEILKPFLPGMRQLEGNITMAGGLGGTLSSPIFYGDMNLKNATIAVLDLPINFTSINAKAKIRGQNAVVKGTFMSGEGQGRIGGTIDWQQKLQAKIQIRGKDLVITQPPLLFAEVNPDLNIIVRPSDRYVNIVGAISVPSATIRPPEANEDVVTKSEDVVVLDRRLIGNIDEVLAITKPWSINADIGVDLGADVNFRGFGAVLPLAGAVHVTQQGQGVMNAVGVIQVSRRSNVDAFGQSLELNYAQIRFKGDVLNPNLSIEAVKEVEGRTVGVRVKNNISEPNIIVFNDAGLTQQQAMNALVTGRLSNRTATQISEEGFKSEVTNTLTAAGLSLGLSGTRSLTNSIGRAFGLQSLTIDASGNDNDTNVNITGYITPDLYIRYGVGVFNAQDSLSVRYQLTRRVYVEATSAVENAVDVVYSFQF